MDNPLTGLFYAAMLAGFAAQIGAIQRAKCDTAIAAIVSELPDAHHLCGTESVLAPNGAVYICAHIVSGEERISSCAVWVWYGGVYSLSRGARRFTSFPDGRSFASAGDQFALLAQEKVLGKGAVGGHSTSC